MAIIVLPGKIAAMKFVRLKCEDLEDLEKMYEMEGNLEIIVRRKTYVSDLER